MSSFFARNGRRVLICTRGKCADPQQGKQLEKQLLQLIEEYRLDNEDNPHHTTCTITNCLGVCENGPVMIVHPEAIKYQHVGPQALEEIFEQHLLNDAPVEHLRVKQMPVNRI